MRMWMVDPRWVCNQHLLGEHVETHMLAGVLRRGTSIRGYVEKGLVETSALRKRHAELAEEMVRRGMRHNSPLQDFDDPNLGKVDVERSEAELIGRCPKCRHRRAGEE